MSKIILSSLKLVELVANYFLPPRCLSCSDFTLDNDGLCGACWQSICFISRPFCEICGKDLDLNILDNFSCGNCMHSPPPFALARSLFKFDDKSKKIIHAFKYYDKFTLADLFAKLICARYQKEIADTDIIVPVPMHRWKRLLRKYNQSFILSSKIAKILRKPLLYDGLLKYKWTKPQAALKFKARKDNLIGSIKVNNQHDIRGKNILLIDDVLTTGNTIKYCSNLLKYAGAVKIIVVTIART